MDPRTTEGTRPPVRDIEQDPIQEDRDLEETQGIMETPQKMISTKIIPAWARDIIRDAEKYGAPEGRKRQIICSIYVALMCNLVDEEPNL